MCTSIIEIARAEGMAKRGDTWFPLSQAVVAYDHARHAPLGDVITLDFLNPEKNATIGVRPHRVYSMLHSDFTGSVTRWSFDEP